MIIYHINDMFDYNYLIIIMMFLIILSTPITHYLSVNIFISIHPIILNHYNYLSISAISIYIISTTISAHITPLMNAMLIILNCNYYSMMNYLDYLLYTELLLFYSYSLSTF